MYKKPKMKKLISLIIIAAISANVSAQINSDILLANPVVSPAPSMVNQAGTVSFLVGYSSNDFPTNDLNGWGPFTIATDPLVVNVTLNNMEPNNADPLLAIVISGDGGNTVTYNAGLKKYTITQTTSIPDGGGYTVSISIKHTAPSSSASPQNGFIAQADIPGYVNDPFNNQSVNKYTYTTGVLPIVFSSVSGSAVNCGNLIKWSTSQEQNCKQFEVESSLDGRNYRVLGIVAATGFSSVNRDYSFTDNAPSAGRTYYRIKNVDMDGKYNYSQGVLLVNKCKEPQVSLFPNPVTAMQVANLVVKNFGNTIKGTLFDAAGKRVQTFSLINGTNKLPMLKYASGGYLLNVKDENGNEVSLRITVTR